MDSKIVNKEIRKIIRPLLKEKGFEKFSARNAWRTSSRVIEVINFQSFNSYLAEGLHCTTFSFAINLGIYYLPVHNNPWIKTDVPEFPQEYECHARRFLKKSINQPHYLRPNIWFVNHNESELPEIVEDAKNAIYKEGFQWFEEMSNLSNALNAFQNKPEIYVQKSIAIEMLGGTLNSMARTDVISGIALELGNIEVAKLSLKRTISEPFYARQPDSIKTLEERLFTLEQL